VARPSSRYLILTSSFYIHLIDVDVTESHKRRRSAGEVFGFTDDSSSILEFGKGKIFIIILLLSIVELY
jgi:hypothetical protein